jgi:hypothetical protein
MEDDISLFKLDVENQLVVEVRWLADRMCTALKLNGTTGYVCNGVTNTSCLSTENMNKTGIF